LEHNISGVGREIAGLYQDLIIKRRESSQLKTEEGSLDSSTIGY
jgi:hypothetical protein